MKKPRFDKILTNGGIILIVPLMLLFGLAPTSTPGDPNPIYNGPFLSENFTFFGSALTTDAWCFDSDGGMNSLQAGFVEGVGPNGFPYKKVDRCDGETQLREFFCNGTTAWPVQITCELGCLDGECLTDCTDGDGDGYASQGGICGPVDCDDTDPLINPAAAESCGDGIDNNCDGLTDSEDPVCVTCTDGDGDGFAVEGGLCGPIDCSDDNQFINPGQLEVCDNGIDDDCDGAVDSADSQCLGTNTIVIGWDGVQRDHFWECYNRELPECRGGLPNVQAIFGDSIFDIVVTSGETSTKPGWAQIFSGYNADTLGIFSNGLYQPIPEGFTVFEKIEDHFGADNVITMFISGKNVNTGDACLGDQTTKFGFPEIESQGQPWCIASDYLDYYENDLRLNETVGQRTLELLELHQNDLIVASFIFREPDVIGHVAGENSADYSESLVEVDMWLGIIVDKLIELGMYENTKIYLTTDHGYDEGGFRHGNGPFLFLATTDPAVVRGGDRMDVGATILNNYGITLEATATTPALHGFPLTEFPTWSCVSEGNPFYDYEGAPACCAGLSVVSFDYQLGQSCIPATGGTGDNSGFCTACGDGVCTSPENSCNCAVDCQ